MLFRKWDFTETFVTFKAEFVRVLVFHSPREIDCIMELSVRRGLTVIRLTVVQPLFLHIVPGLTPFSVSLPEIILLLIRTPTSMVTYTQEIDRLAMKEQLKKMLRKNGTNKV